MKKEQRRWDARHGEGMPDREKWGLGGRYTVHGEEIKQEILMVVRILVKGKERGWGCENQWQREGDKRDQKRMSK
jgi:hypothetical protein